jgi:DNA-binding MurR/RpiR family transcriptional regulator
MGLMKGLLVRIEDYLQYAGEAEKELMIRLQRNPESVLKKTIKEIAKSWDVKGIRISKTP